MPYTRAISSLGAPELGLAGFCALARRHGITAVELRCLDRELDLPAYFKKHYKTPEALREALHAEGLSLIVLDTSFKLPGLGSPEREALLAFVPWAEACGTRWLRVFDGGRDASEGELQEAANTLAWWQSLRQTHNWKVDLVVETHDSLLTAERILRLAALAPGLQILWDTHHTWKMGGEMPHLTWPAIRPHVAHIHVKDSISQPGERLPYTYVLPGAGEFPMSDTLAALNDYSGCLSLEWERQWHPELPPLEAALRAAAIHEWW